MQKLKKNPIINSPYAIRLNYGSAWHRFIVTNLTLSSLAFYNNWNLKKSQLIRRKKEMRLVNICHISVSLHCVVLETLSILTLFNSTESIVQCHVCSNSTYSYWILIFKDSYLSKRLSEAINTLHFWKLFCDSFTNDKGWYFICNPPDKCEGL